MNMFKIVFFSLIITSLNVSAQMNNGMGNRMQNNGMQNNTVPNSSPVEPTAAEIEESRNERIEKHMVKLKPELKLDDLQYIAIKMEILAASRRIDIVMKSNNSEEDKAEEIKAVQEKTEKNINSYLNAEQKEKYKTLMEAKPVKKNEKDKKKKKTEESNTAVEK